MSQIVNDGGTVNREVIQLAEWTVAFINSLPDGDFAYVEPGEKDSEGKTIPRSKRHLPYKSHGTVDAAHLRNALARLPVTSLSAEAKAKARSKLEAAARSAGVGDYGKSALSRFAAALGKKLGWSAADVADVEKQMDTDPEAQVAAVLELTQGLQQTFRDILADPEADRPALVGQTLAQFTTAVRQTLDAPPKGETMAEETTPQSPAPAAAPPEPAPPVAAPSADLLKGMPDELRALVQKALSEAEVAKREAAEAKAQARIEKDARELQDFAKRAETEFASLPGTALEKGAVLKGLYSGQPLAKEEADKVVALLKAADELARSGQVFGELGRSTPLAEASGAYGKIEALAKEVVAKGGAKTLAEAIAQVAQQQPALYQEYRAELRKNAH